MTEIVAISEPHALSDDRPWVLCCMVQLACGHVEETRFQTDQQFAGLTGFDAELAKLRHYQTRCMPCTNGARNAALRADDERMAAQGYAYDVNAGSWRQPRPAAVSTTARPLPAAVSTITCVVCGQPATMHASLGPACPDHYDSLSDSE